MIAQQLGLDKYAALPAFHSLTGYDTVPTFYGKGKKAWVVWHEFPEVTLAFQRMSTVRP